MDSKLKALKVVELKDILAKAAVAVPAKANKTDLINRIIASPKALQIYNLQFSPSKPTTPPPAPQNDDLLAPPEDVDWNSDGADSPDSKQVKVAPKSSPAAPAKPSAKPSAPPPATTTTTITVTKASPTTPAPVNSQPKKTAEDEELEKRKQRASRFGVPLVEPPKVKPAPAKKMTSNRLRNVAPRTVPVATAVDDTAKLRARSARFGIPSPTKSGQKRPAPEEVDAEELEKRKKRAERFGPVSVGNKT